MSPLGLERSHKALGAPAFLAFVDVMNEARLVRLGAGKVHLGAALRANWVDIESPWVALRHARTPWLEYWPFVLHAKSPQLLRQPTRVCSAQVRHADRQSSRTFATGTGLAVAAPALVGPGFAGRDVPGKRFRHVGKPAPAGG
jgi:hypothetical protein